MNDEDIVKMYWNRSQDAITETANKYGKYCHSIAYNILRNIQDSQECVNDTYLNTWNSIPDNRPKKLAAYIGRITRNLALSRYEYYNAKKRKGLQTELALDELLECVSGNESTDSFIEESQITDTLNKFLQNLSELNRNIFVSRYWYMLSIKDISFKYSLTESNIKTSLSRSRAALKNILEKEGIY